MRYGTENSPGLYPVDQDVREVSLDQVASAKTE